MKPNHRHLLSCCVFMSLEKQRAAEQIRHLEDYRFLAGKPDDFRR